MHCIEHFHGKKKKRKEMAPLQSVDVRDQQSSLSNTQLWGGGKLPNGESCRTVEQAAEEVVGCPSLEIFKQRVKGLVSGLVQGQ